MLKVHQIVLTTPQVNQVNMASRNNEPVPEFYPAYLDATFVKIEKAQELGLYNHVADVSTDDLEVGFAVMNRWSEVDEKMVRRHADLHSMSVGDIVEKEDGSKWLCTSFGFTQI